MHNAALAAVGLDRLALPAPAGSPELFAETVRALPAAGFRGANVTIPHKEAALALADAASGAGARDRRRQHADVRGRRAIIADNTDAPALIAGLPFRRGQSALVLGAGGSARAAVWALRGAGPPRSGSGTGRPSARRRCAAELGGTPVATAAPGGSARPLHVQSVWTPERHVQGAPPGRR